MTRKVRKHHYKNKPDGYHAHHIIPLHAGGEDIPSNITFLTVEEHADAHRILFELYGKWQDELAWKTLSGQILHKDAIKIAQQNADKSWMKTDEGRDIMKHAWHRSKELGTRGDVWNKGLTKNTDDRLKISSELVKLHMSQGRLHCIGDFVRGRKHTAEQREQNRQRKLNEPSKICKYCGKGFKPGMYARWHDTKCKRYPGSDIADLGKKR